VKIYRNGELFGEVALITEGTRTASIVAREDAHLLKISKVGFKNIIGK
jgi:CRP-like cAMP-binding protein